MNRKIWHSIFAVIALTLCFSGLSYAQEVTGSIVGTVKDSSGAVVPGATVTVIDPAKNDLVVRTVTATDDGTFSVPNVPVSSYTVTVEAPNFKKSVNTKVKVDVGQRRSIDVALEAIYIHVLRDGWGPYPRMRREVLGLVKAAGPEQS